MPKTKAGLVDLYIQGVDRALEERLPPDELAAIKIRERIRSLVWTRLEIMGPAREAVRSGARDPRHAAELAAWRRAIGWRSADLMWRLAGDTATDFNHYTKRATLGAVYGSTLLAWLDDDSEGWGETAAFLDRRIDDVMRFEKWKARVARLGRSPAQPHPVPRPAALPAALTALLVIDNHSHHAMPDGMAIPLPAHGCLAVMLALLRASAPAVRRHGRAEGAGDLAAARLYRGRLSRGGRRRPDQEPARI